MLVYVDNNMGNGETNVYIATAAVVVRRKLPARAELCRSLLAAFFVYVLLYRRRTAFSLWRRRDFIGT